MKRKLVAALAGAFLGVVSGSSMATVKGGIFFDPTVPGHLETTTVAETLITGNGQELFGYGVVTTVNGNSSYCAVGTCQLFFRFSDYISQNITATSIEFSGGVVEVFRNDGPTRNLTAFDSPSNFAWIGGLTPWVTFTGVGDLFGAAPNATLTANGAILGSSISFTGSGLLEVDTSAAGIAEVQAFLNGNSEFNSVGYGADASISTSGVNSFSRIPVVDRAACYTGTSPQTAQFIGQAGDWCIQGSADLSGAVVPEPTGLTLLGAAALGAGFVGRRMRKSQK